MSKKLAEWEIVPVPYGTIYPSLAGSYNYNHDYTPDWLVVYCPACGSDNVCCLSLEDYPETRWYCIACYCSWRYERDKP